MYSSACVMIGNVVGAGDMKELKIQKRFFHNISILVGLLGMIIMLICRGFITDFYNVTDTTKIYVSRLMGHELCRSIQTMNLLLRFTDKM